MHRTQILLDEEQHRLQIRSVPRERFVHRIGSLTGAEMGRKLEAVKVVIGAE